MKIIHPVCSAELGHCAWAGPSADLHRAVTYINCSANTRSGGRSRQMVTCHKESAIDFFSLPLKHWQMGRVPPIDATHSLSKAVRPLSHTPSRAIVSTNPKCTDRHTGSANSVFESVVHRALKLTGVYLIFMTRAVFGDRFAARSVLIKIAKTEDRLALLVWDYLPVLGLLFPLWCSYLEWLLWLKWTSPYSFHGNQDCIWVNTTLSKRSHEAEAWGFFQSSWKKISHNNQHEPYWRGLWSRRDGSVQPEAKNRSHV